MPEGGSWGRQGVGRRVVGPVREVQEGVTRRFSRRVLACCVARGCVRRRRLRGFAGRAFSFPRVVANSRFRWLPS